MMNHHMTNVIYKSFAKTCFTEDFMQKINIKFRQYLFLVALYETSLLIAQEICFAEQSFENQHNRFKRENYMPFENWLSKTVFSPEMTLTSPKSVRTLNDSLPLFRIPA